MFNLGKSLVLLGIVLVAVGILVMVAPRVPFLGKLPGDLHIKKDNFELFVPITTSVLLSIILSGIFWIVNHLGKK
ncbi:MAG: DUF2905 domain-containing protein [Bacteroidota bacterium]